jgi:hypothetical protein
MLFARIALTGMASRAGCIGGTSRPSHLAGDSRHRNVTRREKGGAGPAPEVSLLVTTDVDALFFGPLDGIRLERK